MHFMGSPDSLMQSQDLALHWKAERDPKANMLSLKSFLWKGVSLGYVGSI